ncbi:unnamed protein product [Fusarium graminearum]|nr:unnamed protein product [Fusarium graminearum]CZS81575.1 unnamed protein product [Fusarium graminearum]
MHDTLIECRMKNRSQSAGQGVIAGLYYSRASLSFTFTLVLIYAFQKTDHIEEHFRICPEVTDHSCDETGMDICSD